MSQKISFWELMEKKDKASMFVKMIYENIQNTKNLKDQELCKTIRNLEFLDDWLFEKVVFSPILLNGKIRYYFYDPAFQKIYKLYKIYKILRSKEMYNIYEDASLCGWFEMKDVINEVEDIGNKILDRKMGESEYNSILNDTHPKIIEIEDRKNRLYKRYK